MFSLIKNFGKNNKNKKNISTDTMSVPEYVVAIKDGMYAAWNDNYVAERITTKTIFDSNAKVKSGLSFDELKEMDARLTRAVEIGNKFRARFEAEYDVIVSNDIPDSAEKDFFSATHMADIIKELNAELPVVYPANDTRSKENLEKGVNNMMRILQNVYTVTIDSTVSVVKLHGYTMYGFI